VREEEFQGAVCAGAGGGDVEAEDGGDVVGGEDTKVLRAVGLVGLRLGDLGDVVRELELAWRQGARAASSGVEVTVGEGAL